MDSMHEWASVAALLGALAAFFTVIGFWTRLSDRITEAKSEAADALQEAGEAKNDAMAAQESVSILREAVNLFRIQIAKDYVDKDMLREMEMRVIAAIDRAAKTSTDAISALTRRIDDINYPHHS